MPSRRHLILGTSAAAVASAPAWMPALAPPAIVAAFLLVYVLPGWIAADRLWPHRGWLERLAAAFGLSFVACLIFSILMVEAHVPMRAVVWIWCVGAGAACLVWRNPPTWPEAAPERALAAAGLLLLAWIAASTWQIGGTYGSLAGEEGYHVIFTRKLYAHPAPAPDNLFYLPGTSSTYLYKPYHFSLALMAALSGLDPMSVFLKFRPFAAIVTLISMAATAQRMTGRGVVGAIALIVLGAAAVTNHAGYHSPYFAQLVPVSHHSDISLGMGLAVGGYFFWSAATAARRFGADFWCGAAVLTTILVCHAREGLQLVVLCGVLVLTGLLSMRRHRTVTLHAAALALLLIVAGKGYQALQSSRASHLAGWEDAEKSVARERFSALKAEVRAGRWGALVGPRIDRTSPYMPNYDVFFRPACVLALAAAPLAFWGGRGLWTAFVPILIGVILLISRLPVLAYALVIGGYSQVLYTPARFVLHWEWLLLAIGAAWVVERAAAAVERRPRWAVLAAVNALFALGYWGLPALGEWMSDVAADRFDLILVAVLIALQVGALRRLFRWSRGASEPDEPAPAAPGWRAPMLAAALLAPCLSWLSPPSLAAQASAAANRPSGLDVKEWCAATRLVDLPPETLEFLRHGLPRGRVVACDPHYIGNIPVVADHHLFTYGFYFSSETPFFERTYAIRGRTPPFDPTIQTQFRYTDAYIRDLMLRFPLFNWRDPLAVTLRDIDENGIDAIVVHPDFAELWRTYAEYFPEAFPCLHRAGDHAVYGVEREALRRALASVRADPAGWARRDLDNGYAARSTADWSAVRARLPEPLREWATDASSLEAMTCFVPALRHYIVDVDGRAWRTPDGEPVTNVRQTAGRVDVIVGGANPEVVLPLFLPKSRTYVVRVESDGDVELASADRASDGSYRIEGPGFMVLTLRGSGTAAVRIVEDEDLAAVEVRLPAISGSR